MDVRAIQKGFEAAREALEDVLEGPEREEFIRALREHFEGDVDMISDSLVFRGVRIDLSDLVLESLYRSLGAGE